MIALTTTITTKNAGGEVEITVFGTYSPADPSTDSPEEMLLEGAEIEGHPVDLSKPEQALALEALWAKHQDLREKHAADREDAEERRRELLRERNRR